MKRLMKFVTATAMTATLVGCGATLKVIERMGQSVRTDVFTEITADSAAPAGFVDLVIKGSLKAPLEGYDAPESKAPVHEKSGYPFLVNIDGQAVVWKVDGQKEILPLYDENGKTSHDPDAGAGLKYILEKKIRLAAGPHEIFFGLPRETYYTKVQLTLKEDGVPVLEFEPRYCYKTIPTRIPTFLRGICGYEAMLDRQIIRKE